VSSILQGDDFEITLDFLGKDSMRYFNTIKVEQLVHANLGTFHAQWVSGKKKEPEDDLFDGLSVLALNKHLKELMPGLSAKVFRTFNASITLERELDKMPENLKTVEEKVLYYNLANRQVAILCNHQKTVSKGFADQIGKIDDRLEELRKEKEELEEHIEYLESGTKKEKKEKSPAPLKRPRPEYSSGEEDFADSAGSSSKRKDSKGDKKGKEKPKKKEDENGEKKKKKEKSENPDDDFQETPKKQKVLPDDPFKAQARLEKIEQSIRKWEIKKTEKDELKTVALGTSKINYMDPRITAAWCKKVGVGVEKIFSQTLRLKFPWAMDIDPDFRF